MGLRHGCHLAVHGALLRKRRLESRAADSDAVRTDARRRKGQRPRYLEGRSRRAAVRPPEADGARGRSLTRVQACEVRSHSLEHLWINVRTGYFVQSHFLGALT